MSNPFRRLRPALWRPRVNDPVQASAVARGKTAERRIAQRLSIFMPDCTHVSSRSGCPTTNAVHGLCFASPSIRNDNSLRPRCGRASKSRQGAPGA